MKCKEGHTKEQMEKQGMMNLPPSLRNHLGKQTFWECPIDGSPVYYEVQTLMKLVFSLK